MSELVRRCPQCGQANPITLEVCEADGQPLFDVAPSPAVDEASGGVVAPRAEARGSDSTANDATQRFDASTAAWLESVSDAHQWFRIWDGAIVGRGDQPDVCLWPAAPTKRYSRRQAFFRQRERCWYVESVPGIRNPTVVNGEMLEEGFQAALEEGDHIAFGDVVFIFHDQPRGGS